MMFSKSKYLIGNLVFFPNSNFFLIAPFPDYLLVPVYYNLSKETTELHVLDKLMYMLNYLFMLEASVAQW